MNAAQTESKGESMENMKMSESKVKAYLSVASHHDIGRPENAAPALVARLAASALSEAREILGEVEPGIWIGGGGVACGWAQRCITSNGGPTPTAELACLVEALAAFVGEGN